MTAAERMDRLAARGMLGDARRIANERKLALVEVLDPAMRDRSTAMARRAIWRHLRDRYELSISEVARVTGFHHVSVLRAIGNQPAATPHALVAALRVI